MIAIIPARGGSKRIPRKNSKDFLGKPVIAYSIEAALASGLFETVMVSTDDAQIAAIAREYGADVPFMRSAEASDDVATTSHVLLEVLERYAAQDQLPQTACCIYPTAPLLDAQDLQQAYTVFQNGAFETLLSGVRFSFPIQRGFRLSATNGVELLHPELIHTRSQDLEATYHDAGAFYFFDVAAFRQSGTLWSARTGAFELPESKIQDIDTPEDWKMAELKYRQLHP